MVRGITLFTCTKCKKLFIALDIEYAMTVYSQPMPCPRCGSIRTLPVSQSYSKSFYKKIWEMMEEAKEKQKNRQKNKQ